MELTKHQQEQYGLFTDYKKKNPSATNAETYRATGVSQTVLWQAKKRLGLLNQKPKQEKSPRSSKKTKTQMQTIVVPESLPSNFAVIICNRQNLSEVLNAIR